MASYDKPKMLRLLARHHAASLTRADVASRRREAVHERGRARSDLVEGAARYGAHDAAERLLALPMAEALTLAREQVEYYESADRGRGDPKFLRTGFAMETWERYLRLTEKVNRLEAELRDLSDAFASEFAIVPNLLRAIAAWGFANPELEF